MQIGEFDCSVEERDAMEETNKVEGPCLAVRLAGLPDELSNDLIKRKLLLHQILCGVLISNLVVEDVQKKDIADDSEKHR